MKLAQSFAAIALAATMALPLATVRGGDTEDPQAVLKKMMSASGKAGAMKRTLTRQIPEAKGRYTKIQTLQEEIKSLKSEIDKILIEKSDEYRELVEKKEQLSREYQAAKARAAKKDEEKK